MRIFWFILRLFVVLGVFGLVGWLMAQVMITHSVSQGTPEYAVRLAAYTGGLFVGGSAAATVGLAMILMHRRRARRAASASDKTDI